MPPYRYNVWNPCLLDATICHNYRKTVNHDDVCMWESSLSCIWNTKHVFCICIWNTMKKSVFVFVIVFEWIKSIIWNTFLCIWPQVCSVAYQWMAWVGETVDFTFFIYNVIMSCIQPLWPFCNYISEGSVSHINEWECTSMRVLITQTCALTYLMGQLMLRTCACI